VLYAPRDLRHQYPGQIVCQARVVGAADQLTHTIGTDSRLAGTAAAEREPVSLLASRSRKGGAGKRGRAMAWTAGGEE
jgi:hypothetical protein